MVRQRVYQIIAGYEDADDCNRLRSDGMLKLCAGRKPSDEIDLASQPTMCRLENKLTKQELYCAILSKLTPCNYHIDPLFSRY